jgi:leader peptidase (prepilin peptidase)/N-methyltransferase
MAPWDVLRESPALFLATMGGLGLLVGSFLNVVIYRLPRMLERQWRADCAAIVEPATPPAPPGSPIERFNLLVPRSRCPHCGHLITARDNVPLVSYALLGGRCRACRARIPTRYPLVEALGGTVAVLVGSHFGFGWPALFAAIFSWALIAAAVIDFDTQLLPDAITLPLMWLGIVANSTGMYVDLATSVYGAIAGYLMLWLVYWVFKFTTGKEGMGYGDFKLLAMIGAWAGWQALPFVILSASLVGAVVGLALIAFRGHDRAKPIPFGPYLATAGWLALPWGERLSRFVLGGGL